MILTCPECSTRYQAKDEAFLPSGRQVRCAKCGHAWHQAPPPAKEDAAAVHEEPIPSPDAEAEAQAQAPAEPAEDEAHAPPVGTEPAEEPQAAAEAPMAPRGLGRDRLTLMGGWVGLAIVVLLIGWASVNFREQIATLWPQSASLYSAFGIKVNTLGLAIDHVKYHREQEDGQAVFAVTGRLVNVSGHEIAVPPVRVTLSGAGGKELYHWDFTAPVSVLHAGQTTNFLTRLSSPPTGVRQLTVQFADAKG